MEDFEFNPSTVYPARGDQRDLMRLRYRTMRRQDPEHQAAVERAVRSYCGDPQECEHVLAVVAQLERDENREILPSDIPAVVEAVRSGEDPRAAIEQQRQSRESRGSVMSPAPEDEIEGQPERVWNPTKNREPPPSRTEHVERAIAQAGLQGEQEATLRHIIQILERNQGPAQPSLIRELVESLRAGRNERTILGRYGV